jgi:hypothetical protein
MSRPAIQSFQLNKYVQVYECHPDSERRFNHWRIWDSRACYNIVMSAKTKEDALIEAIEYWAERFDKINRSYNELKVKIDHFVGEVAPSEE